MTFPKIETVKRWVAYTREQIVCNERVRQPMVAERKSCCNGQTAKNDRVSSKIGWLVWGLPMALLLAGEFWGEAHVRLWIPALVVAGAACFVNAARCGRLHCHFTGPLYLFGAVAILLHGLELVPIGWS